MIQYLAGSLSEADWSSWELTPEQGTSLTLVLLVLFVLPAYLMTLFIGFLMRKKLHFNKVLSIVFILSVPLAFLPQGIGAIAFSGSSDSGDELTANFLLWLTVASVATGLFAAITLIVLAITNRGVGSVRR